MFGFFKYPWVIGICLCYIIYPLGSTFGQNIITVVGTGIGGYSGDGGPAIVANISLGGLVFDMMGNLYIQDSSNRIRKINTQGIISTVGGNGIAGFTGDGSPATTAEIHNGGKVAWRNGNIYLPCGSTTLGHRIRRIAPSGIISTFAGTGVAATTGDGGPATTAEIYDPENAAIDTSGNFYFVSHVGSIRKIDAAGIITEFAGGSTFGFSGDGGPATAALLSPAGLATDFKGNLYIADFYNNRVRKIDTAGIITTIAGSGPTGPLGGAFSGDGGAATDARLFSAADVAINDRTGDIFVTDLNNHRIRKIDTAGIITTVVGTGISGFSGDGGPATAAEIGGGWLAFDCAGNLFIRDQYRIRAVLFDHPPRFTAGHTHTFTVCNDSMLALNSILAAIDSDAGQKTTWSVLSPPKHGTVAGSYSAIATGSPLIPAGFSYTPLITYIGNDTFQVQVSDCSWFRDTVTVYTTVKYCGNGVPALRAADNDNLNVWPNPAKGSFFFNIHSGMAMPANIVVTDMLGRQLKSFAATTNKDTEVNFDLPDGVYIISASTASDRYLKKLVVSSGL